MAGNGQIKGYGSVPQLPGMSEAATIQLEAGLLAAEKKPKIILKRSAMTFTGTMVNLFVPWILFVLVSADMTFSWHYYSTMVSWILAGVGLLVALAIGGYAFNKVGDLFDGKPHQAPIWIVFLAVTSLIAVVSGTWLGDIDYWENMQQFYDIQSLNQYIHVDPVKNHGKQMMDAGFAQFVPDAALDLNFAYKFDDFDEYCVAPISTASAIGSHSKLDYYDFWVVGLNCCPRNLTRYTDFRCGAYNSTTARQGLRLMDQNQRNFYDLAVQQATAAHKIKSNYPIFFFWTEDAHDEFKSYYQFGYRYFILAICCAFAIQLMLLLWMMLIVSKLGY
jgi:hypothetical protein